MRLSLHLFGNVTSMNCRCHITSDKDLKGVDVEVISEKLARNLTDPLPLKLSQVAFLLRKPSHL